MNIKIVKFENGTYAVRKGDDIAEYEFMDTCLYLNTWRGFQDLHHATVYSLKAAEEVLDIVLKKRAKADYGEPV